MRYIALLLGTGLGLVLCVGCTKSTNHLYGTGEESDAAAAGSEGEAEAESEAESESESESEAKGEPDAEVMLADAGVGADATPPAPDAEMPEADAATVEPDAGVDASSLPDAGPDAEPDVTPDLGPDAPLGCVPTTEVCNGADDNCNGTRDEGCPACASGNVVSNPGFEALPSSGWTLFVSSPADATLAQDCSEAHSGSCSGRVTVTSPGDGGDVRLFQELSLPDGEHELCVFLRGDEPTTVEVDILFGALERTSIAVGTDWTGQCLEVVGGAGSTTLRFWIADNTPHTVWLDTVHLGGTTCP